MVARPADPRRAERRRLPLLLAVLAAVLIGAGCGAEDPTRPLPADTTAAAPSPDARDDEDGGSDDAAVSAPSRQARAAGRNLDALITTYAPVSARINFLVAAETLRDAAARSGVSDEEERVRYGAVRLEVQRMKRVLARVRPNVAASRVGDIDQQRVQDLLLETIDARMRAMEQLEVLLDAQVDPAVPDTRAEALEDAWRGSWDQSLRTAREATTTMQELRARIGLMPAEEESFR